MGWLSRLFEKTPSAEPRAEPAFEPAPVRDRTPAPGSAPVPERAPAIDRQAARAPREGSPEHDEFVARAALEDGGDLPHGARHLANLLLVDPRHPRWRELLDRYIEAARPGLDALVPDVDPR